MIKHIKCNVFESGADIIVYIANCKGEANSDMLRHIQMQFPHVYKSYQNYCDQTKIQELYGSFIACKANGDFWIVSLLAQTASQTTGITYTNYEALQLSLKRLYPCLGNVTIAIPYKTGCTLSDDDINWQEAIYPIIVNEFKDYAGEILICKETKE